MSNLVEYAKDELKRIGMIDSGDPYNESVTKAILDLIELFASQDHSGFSASYVINAFGRLAKFKPLSPLTGKDDEWDDVGDGLYQNKRYSAVFKYKDGTPYDINGKVFTANGEVWYTCKDSKVNVTFPYVVPDEPEHVYRNKEKKCHTCKHAFTTGKDRWYCKKSLADKDDCGSYEIKHETVTEFADRCKECGREKVLNKIRAAIIANSIADYEYHGCGTDELIIETSTALQIIDKYKAERSGKE